MFKNFQGHYGLESAGVGNGVKNQRCRMDNWFIVKFMYFNISLLLVLMDKMINGEGKDTSFQ